MSPRGVSNSTAINTRNSATPYSRRPASQPKSTRQQFSACGACRMRRVRCDLKDLVIAAAGPNPSCSNCKERNIKCVDEFADVKAVKLLRRGRRLQQVEALYGKTSDAQSGHPTTPPTTRLPSTIPNLRPEFFASSFWVWFCMQRPILDPTEFPSRFYAHTKGTQSLGHEGGLIAMLLVVWAASFGLDERGIPLDNHLNADLLPLTHTKSEDDALNNHKFKDGVQDMKWHEKRDKTDTMLREVLELIDFHGVMRRPSLDGVRALLLILPLLEDAQPMERISIHETTLSHVLTLCRSYTQSSGHIDLSNGQNEMLILARIFWYAYTYEGLTTGMKGGRFMLDVDDFDAFQRLIPTCNVDAQQLYHDRSQLSLARSFDELFQTTRIPLSVGGVCRKVHEVLMGPKAVKCIEAHGLIEASGMWEIWRELDRLWRELTAIKETVIRDGGVSQRFFVEQYTCGWQLFIFECHNLIRESLKQYMSMTTTQQIYSTPPRPSSSSSASSPYLPPQHLYVIANRKCLDRLPYVIDIINQHLSSNNPDDSAFLRWDTGFIRDACFFAAYLAATDDMNILETNIDDPDFKENNFLTSLPRDSIEDSVAICMAAISRMTWAGSKTEERQQTIKMIWDSRKGRRHHQNHRSEPDVHYRHPPLFEQQSIDLANSQSHDLQSDRPLLPPLSLCAGQRRVESAPSTSYTSDGTGASGWPCYTPPGTATSNTTSTGTGLSASGSPVFPNVGSYKNNIDDTYYHNTSSDLEQFHFNVPMVASVVRDVPVYSQRSLPSEPHTVSGSSSSSYLGQAFTTVSPLIVSPGKHYFDGCPQFGESCHGAYH